MTDITLPLEPNCIYHIFNRGNNKEQIFFEEGNYRFFLQRYGKYMNGYLETFSYCLLSNHFHFMVRVKPIADIIPKFCEDFKEIPERVLKKLGDRRLDLTSFENLSSLDAFSKLEEHHQNPVISWAVSEKIRRFLMSYAKAINKQQDRVGSLLQKPFRRKRVDDESYFIQLIWYIHNNPVHHGLYKDLTTYKWSSYHSFLSKQPTKLSKAEVLNWFGGIEAYVAFHKENAAVFKDAKFWIE